jgi:phosphoenolpyruvate-protein phosphotransferase (PTS system enzyme I)
MLIKKGIPVSPGVAISQAVVVDAEDQPVPRRVVPAAQVPDELKRLDKALAESIKELDKLREQASAAIGAEPAKIFAFHQGMLQDKHLIDQFRQAIQTERVTAEFAVFSVMRELAKMFRQQKTKYLRDRVSDVWDLEHRVLANLIGSSRAALSHLKGESIAIAHDLTPSQTASLDRNKVKGIATDLGGRTSHTAILAHALGIPAVVGAENITTSVNTGDTVIIDGNRGLIIIDPDAAQLMEYRRSLQRQEAFEDALDEVAHMPAVTKDGQKITLLANIEFPSEIPAARRKGAQGVGLYRTEFLFLATDSEPSEEDQYKAYREAVKLADGKPVIIRTLDLGADKLTSRQAKEQPEPNPFLGCRSIRLCLQDLPLFKAQLRAILRASVEGQIKILFPMISSVMELRQARMILSDVMEDLDDEGIAFKRDIPVGIMIEVPAAAIQAKTLAAEVDFFSIGTNDLIQYTIAVDRSNERIASLYTPAHPAVIQLLKDVVRAATRAKIDVSICGEMAGDPEFVMLLLGLGLRSLSMTPPAIPEVKKVIRSVTLEQCQRVARKVGSFDSDREVTNYLRDEVAKVLPEVLDGRSAEY